MDLGKNPGLGIRSLHEMGVTGRGVGIAIIDQPTLVNHREYASQLHLYEEIGILPDMIAEMHGPAVASIAVGKTVGVAPEADLYYLAAYSFDPSKYSAGDVLTDYSFIAQGIRRVLAINAMLPAERKIRVLSMSIGFMPEELGYEDVMSAIQEAIDSGLLVVSTSLDTTHGFDLFSLGREPYADPDAWSSYELGRFISRDSSRVGAAMIMAFLNNCLWVTMDSRTTASPTGDGNYAFYREGGMSWSVPYVAGMYALAAQVDPDITPEEFWSLALKTGRTVWNRQTVILGPILDPAALIAALQTTDVP